MSTLTASDTRKADLSRLHDFFEKLKSHRTTRNRSTTIVEDAPMDDVRPAPVPALTLADLDPAMKKLSNIVDRSTTSTRPRRNTVASMIAAQGGMNDMPVDVPENNHSADEDEAEASALDGEKDEERKEFAFTFKHMVHKLYEKEDWARAVKEELQKSQNEFKSLAEQMKTKVVDRIEREEDTMQERAEDGVVRFKIATSPGAGAGRRGSVVVNRQRSQSIVAAGANKGYTPLSPGTRPSNIRSPAVRSPAVKSPGAGEGKPDLRVVKKRCVGRRKSASGSLNAEANKPTGGSWVYNSAVSASERPVATTFAAFPPGPPPSPTGKAHPSLKYQGLGMKNFPSTMKAGAAGVAGGAGMKRRVSVGNEAPVLTAPLMMPLQHVTNTNGLMARRRVMAANKMANQNDNE